MRKQNIMVNYILQYVYYLMIFSVDDAIEFVLIILLK